MIPIVYLIDTLVTPLGGTERQLLTLLERLDRRRFQPHLAFLRPNPELDETPFPCPVSVLAYRSLAGRDLFRAGSRFVSLCRKKRIQIVHTCFRDATRVGSLWARVAGIPVVVGSRRNLGYLHRRGDVALLRLLAPLTTHTVANSEAAAREAIEAEHLDPRRVSVIANGLDPDRFSPVDEQATQAVRRRWGVAEKALVVGAVANLRPVKNLSFLVDAAARLAGTFPQVCFVVLGEGALRPRLEERIREKGLEGRFLLPGLSANVPVDIQAFDVAVLCSESESSPNSLIEYLASGRPAIASAVGGAPEILVSEDVGFLFPHADAASFDARLAALLRDPLLRSRMGAAARRHALARFSMDRMVSEHESLYQTLLARTHAHPSS